MDVWLTVCRKTIPECSYCKESIQLTELIVCGKLWQRFTEDGGEPRRWIKNFRWHARRLRDSQCCWLEASMENLRTNMPVETRGRKSLLLPKPTMEERLKILRQRARAVNRLKELMLAPPDSKDVDEIIRIGSRIEEMKEKIANLGGVPRSWE